MNDDDETPGQSDQNDDNGPEKHDNGPEKHDNGPTGQHEVSMSLEFLGMDPAQLRHARERQAMASEDFRRSVHRLVEEIPDEHLATLGRLLNGGVPDSLAEYLAGLIVGQCMWVRKICPSCGLPEHDLTAEACLRKGI